jgi:uncharacterized membrane protein
MQSNRDVAVAVFQDPEPARDAIKALKDAGFSGNEISVLMPDRGEARDLAREMGTKAPEGAATGAVAGGVLGGLAGWLTGIGVLAIPGVGPFIAAGAFATALTGAALGAGAGAIAGALIGMGIPEDEARYYEQEVRGGRALIVVQAGSRAAEAERILREYGGYNIHHPATAMGATGPVERGPYDRSDVTPTAPASSPEAVRTAADADDRRAG